MSIQNSHKTTGESDSSGKTKKQKFPKEGAGGWLDLDKYKRTSVVLVILLSIAALSFAALSNRTETTESKPVASAKNDSWLSSLNPFSSNEPAAQTGPALAKEYLYAESRLIAIEDAGATSVPPTDLAIWRPSTGQWWTKAGQSSTQVTVQWGLASDLPAIGDYDGDGKTDFCVFRPSEGNWYSIKSSSNDSATSVVSFGQNQDVPAAADFDGDGRTDIAVWRPSNGTWYVTRSSDSGLTQLQLGSDGDVPSPRDYDGDGKADIAVWRASNSTFYSINSSDGEMKFTNMGTTGEPVSSDYDGDGRADFAVRAGVSWVIVNSSTGVMSTTAWQKGSDIAVQNDYDGDGQVDIATWRPENGLWFIRKSGDGSERVEQWGMSGDVPVPALYRR